VAQGVDSEFKPSTTGKKKERKKERIHSPQIPVSSSKIIKFQASPFSFYKDLALSRFCVAKTEIPVMI
jgi:hypothetical protein